MNQEELYGYLAGFLDADGCIHKNSKTGRWYVNATNVVREPLQRFVDAFGGSISAREPRGRRQRIYQWVASGEVAARFCTAVLPYLIVKRTRAEQALRENFGLKIWPPKPIDWAAVNHRKAVTAQRRAAVKERQRRAFELREQGMSYREIMRALGYRSSAGAYDAVKAAKRVLFTENAVSTLG